MQSNDGSAQTAIETPSPAQQYIVIPARRNVRQFGQHDGPTVEDYLREVRSVWRTGALSREDRLDVILDSITSRVRRELKLHSPDEDPEEMLQVMLRIYGEKRSMQELLSAFYSTHQNPRENLHEFSHRLHQLYEEIVIAQTMHGLTPLSERSLRDQFASQIKDDLARRMLKERLLQEPNLTFLEVRKCALRWAGAKVTAQTEVSAVEAQQNQRQNIREENVVVSDRQSRPGDSANRSSTNSEIESLRKDMKELK
ncbi:unnamed protein product, partial [Candidula unifasciata]